MTSESRRNLVELYAFALREEDARLAELLQKRLSHRSGELLSRRVLTTLRQRRRPEFAVTRLKADGNSERAAPRRPNHRKQPPPGSGDPGNDAR